MLKIVSFPASWVIYNGGALLMMYYHTGIYYPEYKIWKTHKYSLKYKFLEEEFYSSSWGILHFVAQTRRSCMAAAYLFLHYNCIFICEISLSDQWRHFKLNTSALAKEPLMKISHYGNSRHCINCRESTKMIIIFRRTTTPFNFKQDMFCELTYSHL